MKKKCHKIFKREIETIDNWFDGYGGTETLRNKVITVLAMAANITKSNWQDTVNNTINIPDNFNNINLVMQSFLSKINNALFKDQTISISYFLQEVYYNKVEYKSLIEYLLYCSCLELISHVKYNSAALLLIKDMHGDNVNDTILHKNVVTNIMKNTITSNSNITDKETIIKIYINMLKDIKKSIISLVSKYMPRSQAIQLLRENLIENFGVIHKINEAIDNNNIPCIWKQTWQELFSDNDKYKFVKYVTCKSSLSTNMLYYVLGALTNDIPEQYH